jgi:dihydropyrimidinase
MTTLIKSGILITAAETYPADILIEGEKISAIGKDLPAPPQAKVIDASGKLVMPGGVDVHTHLDLPMFGTVSSDDHYTGMKAATFGGTTTVIDFIPQDVSPLLKNVELWHAKADEKAAVDFGFHMNITHFDTEVAKEIPLLIKEGITSVKVFTAYNGRLRLQDGDIFQILRIAREHGLLVMAHCENGDVIDILIREALEQGHTSPEWHALTRPAWGEVESINRIISLAGQAEAPMYIVHMTTAGGVDRVCQAREKCLPVMGETCPQYLFFTMEDLKRKDGAKWICSPPMRTEMDNSGLWQGLKNGSLQVIGTDHCPFFFDGTQPIIYEDQPVAIPGKELGRGDFTRIPNGLPGVGDRLPILWTFGVGAGKISANQFVALTSTNPAKIFGLYPQKGSLLPGSDADVVIWDPAKEVKYGVKVAQHRTDYNLHEGWQLKGFVEKVFLRGNLIVDQQTWKGKRGMGRFIHRISGQVI